MMRLGVVCVSFTLLACVLAMAVPEKGGSVAETHLHPANLLEMPAPVDLTTTLNYRTARKSYESGITLVVQSDTGRLGRASILANKWNGPVSYAILLRENESTVKLDDFWDSASEKVKNHLTIHLCKAKTSFQSYPINRMRNIAMREIHTPFVYVLDIDENPIGDMLAHQNEVRQAEMFGASKPVYVLMSWQWTGPISVTPPSSREQLETMYRDGLVGIKSPYNKGGYEPIDVPLKEWLSLSEPKKTHFRDLFEPYYIIRTSQMLRFDERFVGYGGNYYIHTLEMASEKFEWIVLPNVFNFNDEDPTHRVARSHEDADFVDQVSHEIGSRHGCNDCSHLNCVKNCPQAFGGSPKAAIMLASNSPSVDPLTSTAPSDSPTTPVTSAAAGISEGALNDGQTAVTANGVGNEASQANQGELHAVSEASAPVEAAVEANPGAVNSGKENGGVAVTAPPSQPIALN